jgi:mannose-6-phosphate isomerase-like protein (cupin superfamily)
MKATQDNRQPQFIRPGEGQSFAGLICRVSSASTQGEYCAFEFVTLPGEGVPLHVHAHEDELYYILGGAFEIQCGGKVFTAESGAMAVLPRNVPHAFRNTGKVPARALTVFIPGGFDMFVRELNELSPADAADEDKRNAIRGKYGIRML